MKHFSNTSLPMLAIAIALSGCGRDDVKVYHIETNELPAAMAPAPAAPMSGMMQGSVPALDANSLPKFKYTLPESWKEKPLTQLRVASFEISDAGKAADISVIPLGGAAGGDLANVNRWRGQVGLEAQDEAAVKASAESVTIAGKDGELFDIAGTAPGSGEDTRILGAILHGDDTSWYFKMAGDSTLVAKQKANFVAFLKSVEFGGLPAPSTMDLSQLPPSHPAIPGLAASSTTATTADSAALPTWTVPAGWQPGELAQFLVARYVIKGDGETAATVNVSQLDGDGGGLAPNVNRWRKQLGQAPLADEEVAKLPTIEAGGIKAVLVETSGTDARNGQPASLIGVVLPLGGQTWFYKMMGDAKVVSAQKDALIQFVQSAKYPAAK